MLNLKAKQQKIDQYRNPAPDSQKGVGGVIHRATIA